MAILQFQHPVLITSNRPFTQRIEDLIQQRLSEGLLIRGRWLPREWIGFTTLRRILETYLCVCLETGTRDWDQPLMMTLALTLQSASCARAGDITRSDGYTRTEFLCFKDVTVKIRPDAQFPPTVQDLEAGFVLRYCKGQK